MDIQKLSDESFCNVIIEEEKIYIFEMYYNIKHGEVTMAFGSAVVLVDNNPLAVAKILHFLK